MSNQVSHFPAFLRGGVPSGLADFLAQLHNSGAGDAQMEELAQQTLIQKLVGANAIGEGVHFVPAGGLPDALQVAQVAGKVTRPEPPQDEGDGTPARIKTLPKEFRQDRLLGTSKMLAEGRFEIRERGRGLGRFRHTWISSIT